MEKHVTKYRPDIDGLRAIAVCAVVAFHAYPKSIRGGFAGVDIFFVISGYLISTILFTNLDKGNFSFLDFFNRRIRRIFPSLLLIFFFSYVFSYLNLFPHAFAQLGKHMLGGSTFSSNLFLWNEAGYFDTSAETKPLLHLWSLAIEEQFYIIWPIILCLIWKQKKIVLPTIISIITISFILNIYYLKQYPSSVFYLPVFRFWEILVGTLLAYITKYHPENIAVKKELRLANYRSALGLALLSLGIGILSYKKAFPGWWALLPVIGTFLIISGGEHAWVNKKILAHKKMVAIGLISYPLYLWHWPLLVFLRLRFDLDPSVMLRTCAVILSFLCAHLTFKMLETPLKEKRFSKHQTTVLLVLMTLFGILGFHTYSKKGFPERWPKEIRGIAEIVEPYEYFGFLKNTRTGLCHSRPKKVALSVIEEKCIETKRPLVFLLGDSYAASLYSGLKALQADGHKFGIAQFTNGNTPPFLNLPEDKIGDNLVPVSTLNKENLAVIKKLQPEIVLIAWKFNQGNGLNLRESTTEIIKTFITIQALSHKSKIFIMGPTPEWQNHLSHVYLEYWMENSKLLPVYSEFHLDKEFMDWDTALQKALASFKITYISARKLMCNENGCLTRVGNSPQDLTTVDYGHLSRPAAYFLLKETFLKQMIHK